jgi:RNA polymerase sigma factor (sigma-70 family)
VKVVMMTDRSPTRPFDAFFLEEFPRLVAMLMAWTGSRASAEDLAQDALVQAQQRWDTVSLLDNPGTWVRRVALNRSSNEGRRQRRERAAQQRLRADRPTTADRTAELPDADLWERVRTLSASQRDAIVLRYVDDLPLADIATVLGCSEGSVKKHLQRARRALGAHVSGDTQPGHSAGNTTERGVS